MITCPYCDGDAGEPDAHTTELGRFTWCCDECHKCFIVWARTTYTTERPPCCDRGHNYLKISKSLDMSRCSDCGKILYDA